MMRKGLQISADLALPVDAVTSTMVVYGGKGMGKTNLGGVMVEELAAARQKWAVLDPMGVWWGIRYAADGKGAGVPCLILGGAHGDIPIEPTGGAVVADLVADETVNVVIDISRNGNGEMWSIAERIRFANDYGKQLFRRQGSLIDGRRREPMMQVIDEAARFIPQMVRAGQPELAMCTSTWSTIVEEGRNVGLGVMLLTQRSARLNKDVAELADVMLAFRTVGPHSLEAVTDWLSGQVSKQDLKAMAEQVRSLPVGSCLVVSPGWLKVEKVVPIRMRQTFDSSATPRPGEQARRVRGDGAKPDLQVYASRMRETIERAKEDSVPELKKRIRELEKTAAKPAASTKPAATLPAAPREITAREKAAIAQPYVQERKNLGKELKSLGQLLSKVIGELQTMQGIVDIGTIAMLTGLPEELPVAPIAVSRPTPIPINQAVPRAAREADPQRSGAALRGKALTIAGIVAGYGKRGEGIDKKLLATLCTMTMGGTFSARLSEARSAGAILTDGSMVYATPEGIAAFGDAFVAPSTTEEVVALWRPRLSGKSLAIFDHLVELGGQPIMRAELAEAVGMSMGGTFSARLSEVRSTGLLVESGGGVAVNYILLFMS